MIDVHCHILPVLDDGAIDLDDSVAMARTAEADGIEVVCATPHIHPDHPKVRIDELEGRVATLNDELERRGIRVRVARGGEVAEPIVDTLSDDDLRTVSLDGNCHWLLVEPRPGPLGEWTLATVERLAGRGFRIIVAHPERHPGERFREWIEALVDGGALIQVTAALIAEGPASPFMLELADAGLVHLLGSDAHSSHGGRPLRLSAGVARLAEREPVKPHLDWITKTAPAAILRGDDVDPPWAVHASNA